MYFINHATKWHTSTLTLQQDTGGYIASHFYFVQILNNLEYDRDR